MDSASTTHDNIGGSLNLMSDLSTNDSNNFSGPSVSQQYSSTVVSGDLRCINCGVNVSRLQRHTLEIAEVRCPKQRWVGLHQVKVCSDSLVCHTCWTNAWDEIRHPTIPTPVVGHVSICISCGTSLLRRHSHRLNTDTLREAAIRNIIVQQIAPRQLPRTTLLCHTCWRRTDRAASHSTVEQDLRATNDPSQELEEIPTPNSLQEGNLDISGSKQILLPNYIRAPSTQHQCFFPGCIGTERGLIPSSLRVSLLCDYNYYVPSDCGICFYHLSSDSWDLLLESIYNPIRTFTSEQLEEVLSLLKDNMLMHLDFDNIHFMPDHTVHYYLGFSKQQFQEILLEVLRLSGKLRGAFSLAAYLMELRTGDSDERIASLLKVPRSTLESLMNTAREILDQDFVPRNLSLNHISREDISQRNLKKVNLSFQLAMLIRQELLHYVAG